MAGNYVVGIVEDFAEDKGSVEGIAGNCDHTGSSEVVAAVYFAEEGVIDAVVNDGTPLP